MSSITIPIDKNNKLSAIHKKPLESVLADRERKLVVFMHDFSGHKNGYKNLYADLEFILVDQGFHTLRFDFLGCGKSSDDSVLFTLKNAKKSLDAVQSWAKKNGYSELIFISEGIGSIVAILNHDLNVTCHVMLWPGLDPQYLAKTLFNSEDIGDEWKKAGYIILGEKHISVSFIQELMNLKLASAFRDMHMPTLIMHGSADDQYPVDHLNIVRQAMPSQRIEITTFHNAEHGIPKLEHRKSMFFHIGQFLEKYA